MTIGERIKQRRKQLKLSADYVGKHLGKDRATIYRYEKGEIEGMPISLIDDLAEILNVSPSYLMGWQEGKKEILTEYPLLTAKISAGLPVNVEAITHTETINLPDTVMGKWAGQSDIMIMRVNGESMNKTIPDQSLIAVKPTALENLKDGDIVVYSDSHEYSVKRMYKQDDHIVFRPHSTDIRFTDYIVSTNNENLVIYGKVVVYIVEMD